MRQVFMYRTKKVRFSGGYVMMIERSVDGVIYHAAQLDSAGVIDNNRHEKYYHEHRARQQVAEWQEEDQHGRSSGRHARFRIPEAI